MILVTGATGHLGKKAIEFLIDKGVCTSHIAALARNEEKTGEVKRLGAQIKFGNYDDYDSLVRAFEGVDKLLFVSGSEVEKRDKQHENVVNAANEVGVKRIVYTSFDRANDDRRSPIAQIANTHLETEERIRDSGMEFTFLRNGIYSEFVPLFLGPNVLEQGVVLPAGEGRVPFASRKDMAEAAAQALIGIEHANKTYKTVNVINYSFRDVAETLSEITGKKLEYKSPPAEEYERTLKNAGLPENMIAGTLGWMEAIKQGYFESEYSDMEKLIGRKPMDLRSALEKAYSNTK